MVNRTTPRATDAPDAWRKLRNGLRWQLMGRYSERAHRAKLELFLRLMRPRRGDRVLDLGMTASPSPRANFFEAGYPWTDRITAVGVESNRSALELYPGLRYVQADGCRLPFADGTFDVAFSNGVIEHVGDRTRQAVFVREMLRASRRVFIATPNRWFPFESHTLLPLVHWLPARPREAAFRMLGARVWTEDERLHLLSARGLRRLVPPGARVRLVRQRVLGLTSNLIVVAESGGDAGREAL